MKRCLALAPVALLVSCRLGGPSADPNAYVALDSSAKASMDDASQGGPGDDASVTLTHADAAVAPVHDASPPADDASLPGDDASLPGDDVAQSELGDASTPDAVVEGGGCWAPVAVCDPVHDTGCNPLEQCDVDTTQTSTPTGLCVFNNSTEAGGACTMSIFTESCPPGQTCVSGACKAICFCNANCPVDQCCSDMSGPKGFTLCGTCP